MSNKGIFVISLDFELYWGMFDKVTLEQYGENITGVHVVIPKILEIFRENQIHATWASVGMLMSKNKQELLEACPPKELQPIYPDMHVSSYTHIQNSTVGENEDTDLHHFGANLVEQVIATPHQELGSHTFSHYYCLDGSKNGRAIFAADCKAFQKISQRFSAPITSIVFPRNQTTQDALTTCSQFGLTAYRGTPNHFLYTGKKESEQTNLFLRALRLVDTYINISGNHTYSFNTVNSTSSELKNVQGSWFLRPYNHTLRVFETLKIRRIKNAMTYAAKNNEILHLWWHPHNFGINQERNLQNLLDITAHFKTLQNKYGMQSMSMSEVATLANGQNILST